MTSSLLDEQCSHLVHRSSSPLYRFPLAQPLQRPLRSHPAARTGARKGLESSAASLLDLFRERVDYTVEAPARCAVALQRCDTKSGRKVKVFLVRNYFGMESAFLLRNLNCSMCVGLCGDHRVTNPAGTAHVWVSMTCEYNKVHRESDFCRTCAPLYSST